MIPNDILDKHIMMAVQRIDHEGIPSSRKSIHYDLIIKDSSYPLKLTISLAYEIISGQPFPPNKFTAVEAKNYFLSRGYKVIDRREAVLKQIVDEDEESSFAEGSANYRLHRSYERDKTIVKKAKAKRYAETGRLECEVCDFDFYDTYGIIGLGYIEAHHRIPVSQLGALKKTRVRDLALVCSNCHRILHRTKSVKSVKELRVLLSKT